ncbi:hypothetical protein [Gordonia phage Tarzan]|uniref:Uncharacterized protein n=1 Tax=Gordonia phage Tarzan TaxID=3038367 RepID=A0AAF0GKC0_9CAUD|nr:hypothetical protein QLQ76_gp38 [Gordonia phage Tarzan]WGH20073.1 hypothetical protein [Gordonia phage Tarzan]
MAEHETYEANAWARVRGALAGLAYTGHPDVPSTNTVQDADTLAAWAESYRRTRMRIEAGIR